MVVNERHATISPECNAARTSIYPPRKVPYSYCQPGWPAFYPVQFPFLGHVSVSVRAQSKRTFLALN